VLAEQQAEAEKTNAKMKQKLRDSVGYVVELIEKIRKLEAEVQEMKFADCKSEHDRTVESEDELKKFRKSLDGGTVDRKNAKDMEMVFRLSTNVMPTRVHRDKELTESFQSIQNVAEKLNLTKGSGWLASEKLKAEDRQLIELELAQFPEETGRTKLTRENEKDLCNVCRVLIEALGKINPVLQCGSLTNMFRTMVDRGGRIKAGIDAYSELVMTEQDRLSEDAYKQVLTG